MYLKLYILLVLAFISASLSLKVSFQLKQCIYIFSLENHQKGGGKSAGKSAGKAAGKAAGKSAGKASSAKPNSSPASKAKTPASA